MITFKAAIGGVMMLSIVVLLVGRNFTMPLPSSRGTPPANKSSADTLGYLSPKELPNIIALLAPPPALGSKAMADDEKVRELALLFKDTPMYTLAAADVVRAQPNTVADFQCAFGIRISREATPKLYELLSRVRFDVRAASYPAKSHFARQHPFVTHDMPTCAPADAAMIRGEGSYPSARAAVGWAYGAVLSDLMPQRAAIIRARATQFAQSRVLCGEEWQSDVDAGRIVASATLARERAKDGFRADIGAARKEVAAALAAPSKPSMNCKANLGSFARR